MWWKIKALTFLLAAGAVAFVVHSWFAARRNATDLKTTLSAEEKVIDAASERENLRNRDLQTALARIEALRKRTKSPQQVAAELQQYLQLPVPIAPLPADVPSHVGSSTDTDEIATNSTGLPVKPEPKLSLNLSHNTALFPAADVATLYTYAQDCRECELKVIAANANLDDMKRQIFSLTRERDAALATNRHGLLNKMKWNFLWFAAGAGSALAYDRLSPSVRNHD